MEVGSNTSRCHALRQDILSSGQLFRWVLTSHFYTE